MRIIKYFRRVNYGIESKYIHPDYAGDQKIIQQLTGKKTIDSITMELIRDLTGAQIRFVETFAP